MSYLKIYKWNAGHVGLKIYDNNSKEYYALLPKSDPVLKYGNNNQDNNSLIRKNIKRRVGEILGLSIVI